MPEQYDLVIRGGTVYDGSGAAGVRADLGVRGDRVAHFGELPEDATAGETIDATGLAVAPGFIDVHAHDDALVFTEPDMTGKSMQGVTTVVNGNCGAGVVPYGGISRWGDAEGAPEWDSYAGYFAAIERHPPSINVAMLVGYGTMRAGAMGGAGERRPPTEDEAARIREGLREGLEAGAVGMSTGLIYEPGRYTTTDELAMIARECADFGALYASHTRNEGARVLEAHAEAIEIGRRAGVAVQISHHKASGEANWGAVAESLAQIEQARARGQDVTADQYPYTASSTVLAAMVQNASESGYELDGESIIIASCAGHEEWEGRSLAELAEELDLPVDQAAARILDAVPSTLIVHHSMSEDDVRMVLVHPTTMIGTDGLGYGSKPHPRHFGSYPRILGKYVREEGLLSLEAAIHKMTGMAAAKFELPGRGVIAVGAVADLVLFDPATVAEVSTYEDPRRAPAGMPHVIVNGVAVVRDGKHTHARAGRPVLRGRE